MFKKIIVSLWLSASVFAVQAAPVFQAQSFEDQFEKTQSLDEKTQWVIFSIHKEGGAWVKESLTALKIDDLAVLHWLYVADISAMPGFITKMVAIPKMKDYPFAIGLDMEGDATKAWPKKENEVAVYKMHKLEVVEVHFFQNAKALRDFLANVKDSKNMK